MLKILVLHGYLQNAETFSKRLGVLRKSCRDLVEFTFADGPNSVPLKAVEKLYEKTDNAKLPENPRAWWLFDPNNERNSVAPDGCIKSLNSLLELTTREKFDGIFAFSQGAGMATLFLFYLKALQSHYPDTKHFVESIAQENIESTEIHKLAQLSETFIASRNPLFRFAILVSGFRPDFILFDKLVQASTPNFTDKLIDIPSLHVYGLEDDWVPPSRSIEMSTLYSSNSSAGVAFKQKLEHTGRHYVPTDSNSRQVLVDFFKTF